MTEDDVRAMLLKRAKRFAKYKGSSGVNGWCRKHGVSRSHANEFLNGKRGACTDLLDALGLEYQIVRKPTLPAEIATLDRKVMTLSAAITTGETR